MVSLITHMPERDNRLELVRSTLVRGQETESPSFHKSQDKLRDWRLLGYSQDPRRALLPAYAALDFADIVAFYRRHVAGRPLAIMIVGDPRKADPERLRKYRQAGASARGPALQPLKPRARRERRGPHIHADGMKPPWNLGGLQVWPMPQSASVLQSPHTPTSRLPTTLKTTHLLVTHIASPSVSGHRPPLLTLPGTAQCFTPLSIDNVDLGQAAQAAAAVGVGAAFAAGVRQQSVGAVEQGHAE